MTRFYKRLDKIFERWIDEFTHIKGGYGVWQGLSDYKKSEVKKRVIKGWFDYLFTDDFKLALFFGILTDSGTPTFRGRRLYDWTVDILYSGNERKLYQDWVRLIKEKEE